MKSPKLFLFRSLALPVVAAMLVMLWPVLPPAAADSGLTQIHVDQPTALAVNSTTNEIYVTSSANNSLAVIDGTTDTVSRVVPIGLDPRGVAVDPATGKIYVACYGSDALTVFDEGSGSISSVSVGPSPLAVAVDQTADKIYIVNEDSSFLTVVDGATNSVSTIRASFTLPRDVAVNDATGMVYVAANTYVYMIDPKAATTTMLSPMELPRGMAVDQNTGEVYVADWDGNDVLAISNNGGASPISVGTEPIDVAVNQATGLIYAADAGSNDLAVIDGTNGDTTSIGLDAQPIAVAVNPTTGNVYVLSQDGNSVTVIDGNAAASSPASGTSTPGSTATTTPAQQTVITLDIGQTAYSVNGATYEMDTAPVLEDGRTLLPISYVATALGASVAWNAAGQEVTVSLNGKTLELWIGRDTAMVNGVSTPIDPDNPAVAPILAPPGRALLPLRFISENLGCQVDWNPSLQEVTLTYPQP